VTPLQSPEQHSALETHDPPEATHVDACAALGATIEVITGTATNAPIPMARINWRLDKPFEVESTFAVSRLISSNCAMAILTVVSFTDVLDSVPSLATIPSTVV